MTNPEYNTLNDRQLQAVHATEGRIRVVAGAGSGKTKALTCRYAYLVNEMGVDPANILCLTFTNKAAQEMRQRIHRMVPGGHYNDFVCTIHGFCVKFLRQEIYRLGYPKSFAILDEDDQKQLAKQVMEELGLNRTVETVGQFLDAVANRKVAAFLQQPNYIDTSLTALPTTGDAQSAASPTQVVASPTQAPPSPAQPAAQPDGGDPTDMAWQRYLQLQLKTLSLDFQDLIFFTIHILKRFPDACQYWQNEMEYIMLDEAQDCNKSDWTIVETLQGIHHNLFIVGDPDQAIYEWRGARPRMFIDFRADQTIVLDQNYRSTTPILDLANSVISRNRNRLPKNLFTTRLGGTVVTHFHGRSDQEEARWIARRIQELTAPDATPSPAQLSDVAVLYRASYLSRGIEQELVNAGIDYVIWGGVRFFDRAEVKDALAYLRLIARGDDLAFLRICNTPSRKVGKVYLARLKALADADGATLYDTLKRHISARELYKESMIHFIDLIEQCRQLAEERSRLPILLDEHGTVISTQRRDHVISDVLDLALEQSGYKRMLRADDDTDRLDNLNELLQSVQTYEQAHAHDDELTIDGYLQEMSLYTDAEAPRLSGVGQEAPRSKVEAKPKVRLMTIHQSKGLEFPYVFVSGLSEGIFPSMKTLRERKGDGEEEERRLMYVAVTRAERGLYLTESEGFSAAARLSKYPSRFLREIQRTLFVTEGDMDDQLWRQSSQLVHSLGLDFSNQADASASASQAGASAIAPTQFAPGARVRHQVLGEGVIVNYNEQRGSYTVNFGTGTRNIRASFLTLVE